MTLERMRTMQIRLVNKKEKLLPNKVGTHFGSVNNWIASQTWYPHDALTIGNGATAYFWSDRHDHAERTDKNGFSESQTYEFTPNPKGRKFISEVIDIETEDGQLGFILEPRAFNPKTNRFRKEGTRIGLGQRSEYWCPSF